MRNDAKLGCEGCDAAIVGDRIGHPNMVQGYVSDKYITGGGGSKYTNVFVKVLLSVWTLPEMYTCKLYTL